MAQRKVCKVWAAYADRIDLLLQLGWDWSDAEERTGQRRGAYLCESSKRPRIAHRAGDGLS